MKPIADLTIFRSLRRINQISDIHMWIIRHFIRQTFLLSYLESDIDYSYPLRVVFVAYSRLWFNKLDVVRYFSDVKDDKHTIETCFHNGNVRLFSLICEIWGSGFTLPFKSGSSGHLFFSLMLLNNWPKKIWSLMIKNRAVKKRRKFKN